MSRGRPLIILFAALIASASPVWAREQYEWVTMWGSRDIYPGYLNWVPSLECDRFGNVYVADQLNNRVQKFSGNGALLGYWGSSGAGPGQFDDPFGIAVDSTEYVYVADGWNHRVQVFSPGGGYYTQWGQYGSDEGDFFLIEGIAVSRTGYVYTIEGSGIGPKGQQGNNRVQKFTNFGSFVYTWPGVLGITDVAVDRSGNVFTTDGHTVYKYASTGSYLTSWGNLGSGPGQFQWPNGLGVDKDGNVYVADTQNNRVQKFSNNGEYITTIGGPGGGAGQFDFPLDVAVDDSGYVFVSDTRHYRIQKFRQKSPNVLLVHGVCGDSTAWNLYAQILADSGYVVHRYQYGSHDYNLRPAAYVNGLAAKLDAMKADRIAVIAHSMGGLITREYMRRQINAGKHNPISQLVTVGTPHHGSDLLATILEWGTILDVACSLLLPGHGPCDAFNLVAPFLDHCLGSPYSRPALRDMLPGSAFLNQLNYAEFDVLYDNPSLPGYVAHQPEMLAAGVYHASIGGTGSFCEPLLRDRVWKRDGVVFASDGTVAAGSAILANNSAFRSIDIFVPAEECAHTAGGPTGCHPAYYTSANLGRKLATLLATSPAAPPVQSPPEAWEPVRDAIEAGPQDSLRALPGMVATLEPGTVDSQTVTIGATTLMRVSLLSTDAHLSLVDPNGTTITENDTSAANGIGFFTTGTGGYEGFTISAPLAGSWTFRADGSASSSAQDYGLIAEVTSPLVAKVWVSNPIVRPNQFIIVFAEVKNGGTRRNDVTWTCRVMGPDDSVIEVVLYDDGAHADGQPGDGLYAALVNPEPGAGGYRIGVSADVPGAGSFAASTTCELVPWVDLAVRNQDVWLSTNLPQVDDSMSIFVVIRNQSTVPSNGVQVEVRDLTANSVLTAETLNIAAFGTTTLQVPWRPSAPDTHQITVNISPYEHDELDFTNNSVSRQVVLGTFVGVNPRLPGTSDLRFDLPRPNPSSGAVSFAFALPRSGPARLDIFDVQGRRVRAWSWAEMPAGPQATLWDGRDAGGAAVGPGLYLCRLSAGGRSIQRKLVIQR